MTESRNGQIFIIWDTKIPNLGSIIENLVRRNEGYFELTQAGRGGSIEQNVLKEIESSQRVLAFLDLPNIQVGLETGFALGQAKNNVALLSKDRTLDWLKLPPLCGSNILPWENAETIASLDDRAFTGGPKWNPTGKSTLLLCPNKNVEGQSCLRILRKRFPRSVQLRKDGWDLQKIDSCLRRVSDAVWVIPSLPTRVEGARDADQNAANAVVAGFALARGASLRILQSQTTRGLADIGGRAELFADLDEFENLLPPPPRRRLIVRAAIIVAVVLATFAVVVFFLMKDGLEEACSIAVSNVHVNPLTDKTLLPAETTMLDACIWGAPHEPSAQKQYVNCLKTVQTVQDLSHCYETVQ